MSRLIMVTQPERNVDPADLLRKAARKQISKEKRLNEIKDRLENWKRKEKLAKTKIRKYTRILNRMKARMEDSK